MEPGKSGTLYLCATPIGNLGDITERVLEVLRNVDLIAAEDTRVTQKLLAHFDIHTPLTSYHEHNATAKGPQVIAALRDGKDVALTTDAGTPAISDPGEDLVRLCIDEDIPVTSLPGPSALITALTLSGLSARRFVFEGFLPRTKKDRAAVLSQLKEEERTILCYEAPHRIQKTLEDLRSVLGEGRRIALCRELTKKFEEVRRQTIGQALRYLAAEAEEGRTPRGEYVLVIEGMSPEEKAEQQKAVYDGLSLSEHVAMQEALGLSRADAMRAVAKERGMTKRDVYQALLSSSKGSPRNSV